MPDFLRIKKLPKWAEGRHIYVFAGTELLAQRLFNDSKERVNDEVIRTSYYSPLQMKPPDGRCNGCGSCCSTSGIAESLLEDMKYALNTYRFPSSPCSFYTNSGCLLRGWIPFSCAKSVCTVYKSCNERVEVVV